MDQWVNAANAHFKCEARIILSGKIPKIGSEAKPQAHPVHGRKQGHVGRRVGRGGQEGGDLRNQSEEGREALALSVKEETFFNSFATYQWPRIAIALE